MTDSKPHDPISQIVSAIAERDPLQRKSIKSVFTDRDEIFWRRADSFAGKMLSICEKENISLDYLAGAYLKMCKDMLKEQVKFKRTGQYSCKTAADANQKVYSSEREMSSYMYGLAISQFLWPNHYAMYDFFINESSKLKEVSSCLDVGPGHGVYLAEALRLFPLAEFTAIDISPISIGITKKVVKEFCPGAQCRYVLSDINDFDSGSYNYIVMCEVLEHLDSPREVLTKVREFLSPMGHLFLTTCANCPAIDHVYLYDSVNDIRQEIGECGYEIVSDLPVAVGDFPENQWKDKKVEINYAALVKRAEK